MIQRKFSDWMRLHRPLGYGSIVISSLDKVDGEWVENEQSRSIVTEVICDFCNAEISPQDKGGNERVSCTSLTGVMPFAAIALRSARHEP